MLIIKSDTFDQMQKFERYTANGNQKKKTKEQLMRGIVEALRDEWYTYKDATKAVFDDIAYKAADRGYSFNGYETITSKFDVSIATAKRIVRRLKDTGLVFVAYRKNPKGRGAKTPVIFFREHPHFDRWKSFLKIDDTVNDTTSDTVCESYKPTEASDEADNSVTTYNSPKKYNNNINQYSKSFVKYVPSKLQNFVTIFGNELKNIWLRFNLAAKKLDIKLDKVTKETIGRNVLNSLKACIDKGQAVTEEERLKLVYTISYNHLNAIYGVKEPSVPKRTESKTVVRREKLPKWFKKDKPEDTEFVPSDKEKTDFKKLINKFKK